MANGMDVLHAGKYFKKLKPNEKKAVVMVGGLCKNSFQFTHKESIAMGTKLYVDERETFLGIMAHHKCRNKDEYKEWFGTLYNILDKDIQDRICKVVQIMDKSEGHDPRYGRWDHALATGLFCNAQATFKGIEDSYEYSNSMAKLWCVNKGIADMKGDNFFFNETMMLLANTGFASMGRERIFVTI